MPNLNKFLVAVISALLTSESHAVPKAISTDCLALSDKTAGQQTGEEFSHATQLTTTEKITDDLRVQSVKTCIDEDGELTGLQFILGLPDYSKVVKLDAVGNMATSCTTTTFAKPITTMKANSDERGSGVNNLRIRNSDEKIKVSKMGEEYKQWDFNDEKPLIGLWGR